MILEIGKSYVEKFYNGNLQNAVTERDGIEWTQERIKAAFNAGNGTNEDLKRYMQDNGKYAYFVTI